jgi:hypothetical protein
MKVRLTAVRGANPQPTRPSREKKSAPISLRLLRPILNDHGAAHPSRHDRSRAGRLPRGSHGTRRSRAVRAGPSIAITGLPPAPSAPRRPLTPGALLKGQPLQPKPAARAPAGALVASACCTPGQAQGAARQVLALSVRLAAPVPGCTRVPQFARKSGRRGPDPTCGLCAGYRGLAQAPDPSDAIKLEVRYCTGGSQVEGRMRICLRLANSAMAVLLARHHAC